MLKLSHGIEIGAYNAYQGHWNSVTNINDRGKIKLIQFEELRHKQAIAGFLRDLGSTPSDIIDIAFEIIGTLMGLLCYCTGRWLPNLAASLIETMGVINYQVVAKEATSNSEYVMAAQLLEMAAMEVDHKEYFQKKLKI